MSPPGLVGAGVILAAGASRRMGTAKAMLAWNETTFLGHAAHRMQGLALASLSVVTRAELLESCGRQISAAWQVHCNPDPEAGMLSSLQVALRNLPSEVDFLLVSLVDQPKIHDETFALVAAEASASDWCCPAYNDQPGHPVAIGRSCFRGLMDAAPQGQPREVLRGFPRRLIACPDPGILHDVDYPEDLN